MDWKKLYFVSFTIPFNWFQVNSSLTWKTFRENCSFHRWLLFVCLFGFWGRTQSFSHTKRAIPESPSSLHMALLGHILAWFSSASLSSKLCLLGIRESPPNPTPSPTPAPPPLLGSSKATPGLVSDSLRLFWASGTSSMVGWRSG